MLRGANTLNLDAKGRLTIPERYRDDLMERCDGQLVITVNNTKEHCLWIYPLDVWQQVEQKVVELPSFDPNHQKLKRFLLGYASDTKMDKNGRVLVSLPLREFATITKQVYLIGQGNKFELWDEGLWNTQREQWLHEELDMEKVSVEIEQLSL